jgi:hypothetical protein
MRDLGDYSGPANQNFGPLTEDAVRNFQNAHGLQADGVVAGRTLYLLIPEAEPAETTEERAAREAAEAKEKAAAEAEAARAQAAEAKARAGIEGGGYPAPGPSDPDPADVEYTPWSEAKKVFAIGMDASVYDVKTGLTYTVRSFSNGNHADVEPVTVQDTAIMKETFDGVWKWDPRPVWVTVNGRVMACSINGMPHGGGVNANNGMDGQICIHFLGSATHNGNTAFGKQHQDAALEAYEAAKALAAAGKGAKPAEAAPSPTPAGAR